MGVIYLLKVFFPAVNGFTFEVFKDVPLRPSRCSFLCPVAPVIKIIAGKVHYQLRVGVPEVGYRHISAI